MADVVSRTMINIDSFGGEEGEGVVGADDAAICTVEGMGVELLSCAVSCIVKA